MGVLNPQKRKQLASKLDRQPKMFAYRLLQEVNSPYLR